MVVPTRELVERPEPVGGQGQYQIINASGGTYGDADITHLLAGSGGGGGNERQGRRRWRGP